MGAKRGIRTNLNTIGSTVGVLKVLDIQRENGRTYCRCRCECGLERKVGLDSIKNKAHDKCMCSMIKHYSENGKKGKKHGETNTRLYQIWENVRQRCYNHNSRQYDNYGGRGIKMCQEWDSFLLFKELALHNGYTESLTLDKRDNDKDYSPENCRWITNFEQQANMRKNVYLTFKGKTHHVSEWARQLGIGRSIILYRIKKEWPLEQILSSRKFTNNRINML